MNRTEKIEVKLTVNEKQKLRDLAERHGLKMSQYVRVKTLPMQEVEA